MAFATSRFSGCTPCHLPEAVSGKLSSRSCTLMTEFDPTLTKMEVHFKHPCAFQGALSLLSLAVRISSMHSAAVTTKNKISTYKARGTFRHVHASMVSTASLPIAVRLQSPIDHSPRIFGQESCHRLVLRHRKRPPKTQPNSTGTSLHAEPPDKLVWVQTKTTVRHCSAWSKHVHLRWSQIVLHNRQC